MVEEQDGMVVDDSGTVYYSDPEELAWIKRMKEAGLQEVINSLKTLGYTIGNYKKADEIWKEDGGTGEDEDDEEQGAI